jgi:predicted 2-oxoglutarate/Fe(II)-dependent dioxygenase YbiX
MSNNTLPLPELTPYLWQIHNFLSPNECTDLIKLALAHGFEQAGVRTSQGYVPMQAVRNNLRCQLAHPEWVQRLWQRLASYTLPILEQKTAVGLPRELRFYQYQPHQRFKMHKDGAWFEEGLQSELTFLVYLNEDCQGGETRFKTFSLSPKQGTAVLFKHDTWHEGGLVRAGRKYVLRSDVLYQA